MSVLSVKNVGEYKAKYADQLAAKAEQIGKEIDDEMITKAIYKKISKKADVDFYSFYRSFNPDGVFANIDNYRFQKEDSESNDTDLINKAYEELQSTGPVRYKDFVNTFAPKTDTEVYDMVRDDYNIFGIDMPKVEYSTKDIAEMRGINPDTDVGLAEVGFAQSLARDDANKTLAAKSVLSEYFNQDVPIRYGPETEELEFLNPDTGKYELLNKPGLDAGDLARFGGTGAFVIPEIIATTFAAGTTGPGGAVITSAASSALLETARLALGHEMYGINKTPGGFLDRVKDYAKKEGKDMAVINGLLTQAGFTVPKLYKMVKQLKNTGKINASEFGGTVKNAEQAQKLLENINTRLAQLGTERRLKFTLGQAGNDPELLALQNAYETNPKYGVKGTFDAFNEEQAQALNTYFKLINDQYNYASLSAKNPIGADDLGRMIKQKIEQRLDPRQKILTKALENAETDLTDALIKLPDGSQKEIGQNIRNVIQDLYKGFEDEYDLIYKELFKTGGKRKIKTDLIKDAVKTLNKRQRETLFAKYPEISTFFKTPKGKEISIQKLKNSLSDLRRFDRQLTKGTIPVEGEPVEGAVSKLIGAIKSQFKKDLGEDDVWYRELLKADQEYARNKQLYKGIVGDIIQTKNGRLVLGEEDIFRQTFKKGRGQQRRIDEIFEVIKNNPEAKTTYKEGILSYYKNIVDPLDTGKINLKKHDQFMKDYKYGLETFFGKKEFNSLTNIGELAKKVERATDKRNLIMRKLGTSTKGKLESMDPDKIFDYVYNNNAPTTLNKVLTIIKDDKDLLRSFQSVAKERMELAVTNNRGQFEFDKFANYLKNNRNLLTRTFADNPQYVKDLNLFRDALEVTTRKSAQKTIGKAETALNDIIRARLGQFTVAGRTFTAIKKIVRADIDRQLTDIIVNPKKLDELLSLKDVKPMSNKAKQTISRLFGYYVLDEKFFEDDTFTPTMIDWADTQDFTPGDEGEARVPEEVEEDREVKTITTSQIPSPQVIPDQGLASIQTRQNYDTLFPQDELGSAIAQRRTT